MIEQLWIFELHVNHSPSFMCVFIFLNNLVKVLRFTLSLYQNPYIYILSKNSIVYFIFHVSNFMRIFMMQLTIVRACFKKIDGFFYTMACLSKI